MTYLMGGLVLLGITLLLARAFVAVDIRALLRFFRYTVAVLLIAFGAVLALGGRWGLGLAVIAFGFSAAVTGRLGPLDLGGGARTSGSSSTVRTGSLEMQLDHDSGEMDGRVMTGAHAGSILSKLGEAEVLEVFAEVSVDDGESAALLAAYLDRRMPGWRDDVEGDPATGTGGATNAGPMADEEAYEILGLAPGAAKSEIRAAHRRLMKRVHPDQGGSTFLAAKINQAKDRLLGDHR